jgi:PAS domain S-box-containing protein
MAGIELSRDKISGIPWLESTAGIGGRKPSNRCFSSTPGPDVRQNFMKDHSNGDIDGIGPIGSKNMPRFFDFGRPIGIDNGEHFRVEKALSESRQFLHAVIDNVGSLIYVKDVNGRFVLGNQAIADIYGTYPADLIGKNDADLGRDSDEGRKSLADDIAALRMLEERLIPEESRVDSNGDPRWYQTVKRPVVIGDNGDRYLICISRDLTETRILKDKLQNAEKMESLGRLAAGIAHEINSPVQYVGDNLAFISDAFEGMRLALLTYATLLNSVDVSGPYPVNTANLTKEIENVGIEYLLEEVPNALAQSLDGLTRIAEIVRSMKDFACPDSAGRRPANINRAIESTIKVARNEWKYVAEVETDLDEDLPLVPCFLGEFNQVILNLIVNAAHAIADVIPQENGKKGRIAITTSKVSDEWVEIRIRDTGTGVPPQHRDRIFDHFYTTKENGRGTGQGLWISRSIVEEKHGGRLSFETEPGVGTTFIIQLPLRYSETITSKGDQNYDQDLIC